MYNTLLMILIASIMLMGVGLIAFFWAFKGGQFDDDEKSKMTVLFDSEEELFEAQRREAKQKEIENTEG